MPATFFLVGNYLNTQPDLVKQMVEDGHIVGNHTNNHPDMSKMSTFEDFKDQIIPNEEKYKAITGKEMKKYYLCVENRNNSNARQVKQQIPSCTLQHIS